MVIKNQLSYFYDVHTYNPGIIMYEDDKVFSKRFIEFAFRIFSYVVRKHGTPAGKKCSFISGRT
jgi:hypothetical protein